MRIKPNQAQPPTQCKCTDTHLCKPHWLKAVAEMVCPTEPVQAAAAMSGHLARLDHHVPYTAYTEESALFVAEEGRQITTVEHDDGVASTKTLYGPLSRVPTFVELKTALDRWGFRRGEPNNYSTIPDAQRHRLVGSYRPRLEGPPPEVEDRSRDEAAQAHVADVVKAFVEERTWSRPGWGPDKPAPPKPRHLTATQLAVAYRQAGFADPRGLAKKTPGPAYPTR